MGKRLIPGKTIKDKGKIKSHRPQRSTNAEWHEGDRKWYKKKEDTNGWCNINSKEIFATESKKV